MESNKNLVFLGMMGSGKTTLGKIVSKKLNKEFIDVDQAIEVQEDMVISEIFEKKGERFFRILEEKISLLSLKKKNTVISLGGGAFLNKKIQKEIFTFFFKYFRYDHIFLDFNCVIDVNKFFIQFF